MQPADIEALFLRFAAPLSGFAALGGRAETVDELARNLWMVLLAGDEAEEAMWHSLAEADSDLGTTVKQCYLQEMKPQVNAEQLQALRQRYWGSADNE